LVFFSLDSAASEPLVAVVAVDGENDAPFKMSAKLPVSKGFFVTVIAAGAPGDGGLFHSDIERVENYKQRKRAEELRSKYVR
jgi:hypothetical protein